ncbi:hypothetical protein FACS1894124_8330 [Spirochaetia bacterium]|jgi:four helix bundle protein|nr:hypothetical protein FACS1894124_8330 [Spirochaetia bacterium]
MSKFRTLNLAIEFHKKVEREKVRGHLRDQLLRSSSSIALNLSEGNARPYVKEKRRFYQTAFASLKECQTALQLTGSTNVELAQAADRLGARIYRLMNSKLKAFQNTEF